MAGRLEGKVCVITGAGGGMGADAAVLFTEEGAEVCVADVDGDAAEAVAYEVGGLAVRVDVGDGDLGALLGEADRGVGPHAPAGTGDHADLALEPTSHQPSVE